MKNSVTPEAKFSLKWPQLGLSTQPKKKKKVTLRTSAGDVDDSKCIEVIDLTEPSPYDLLPLELGHQTPFKVCGRFIFWFFVLMSAQILVGQTKGNSRENGHKRWWSHWLARQNIYSPRA